MERILCAAIHFNDDSRHVHQPKNIPFGVVVCGRRHHNCYATISWLKDETESNKIFNLSVQGFVTSEDRFVDRAEAYRIAKAAGQLLHDAHDRSNLILISEDIY